MQEKILARYLQWSSAGADTDRRMGVTVLSHCLTRTI